jgi:hypothetical protein
MAIAKLTGQGLTAIAISVGLLWGCILGERIILQNANLEADRTLMELRQLKMRRHTQPVAAPSLKIPRPAVSVVG